MITTVRVWKTEGTGDPRGAKTLHEIRHSLGIQSVNQVRTVRVFRLEDINVKEAEHLARWLLCDPILEEYSIDTPSATTGHVLVEVAYQPGMTNPEVASLLKSASDLGVRAAAADISVEYHLHGPLMENEVVQIIDRLLVNKTTQMVVHSTPETLVIAGIVGPVETVPILRVNAAALMLISDKRQLHLSQLEMTTIQQHFRTLERAPTDAELETLAQTWSEHCVHKTFRSPLIVEGRDETPLFERLRLTSQKYDSGVVSLFVDNSGVLAAFNGWCVCGKVETHNSPSAIEPYGGAATGVGGVIRDILGTGQGALVVLNTDMFCFGLPDMDFESVPAGCLHPDYILRNVVAGVGGYGNPMGIPTSNGSVHFHPDFTAKPTVIVGSYGLIPEKFARKGEPAVGDRIVVLGGRTGRDGIHGATFSSAAMTAQTISVNASAVQIGNPIEEKAAHDAVLAARDRALIVAITDCGAGGLSSAIGEMGSKLGVSVQLERAPLKYTGLAPWEIWISESQERMVAAVHPDNVDAFISLCEEYGVEATDLGEFTGDQRLLVIHGDEVVCDLSMEFLHNGVPLPPLEAQWQKPELDKPHLGMPLSEEQWVKVWKQVLAHPDVCSKEALVKRYDQGVQGGVVLPAFTGEGCAGPNDAVVLRPVLGEDWGLVVSHGLNPILNRIDPYWGSIWAAVEALANYVAVGGAIDERMGLIDNFIWPTPDPHHLGALNLAVRALCDVMDTFQRPFISGKDSLSSTYRGKDNQTIHIPPVMCISAFGSIEDANKTVSSDFKKVGSNIVLLGQLNADQMGGSVYYRNAGLLGEDLPQVKLEALPRLFERLHELIVAGKILACHDISEGGVATTLAEMCIGGGFGAQVDIGKLGLGRADHLLFNEMAGCFLVEIDSSLETANLFADIPHAVVGQTTSEKRVSFSVGSAQVCSASIEELHTAWTQTLAEVFP